MNPTPAPLDELLEHRAWVRSLARTLVRDPQGADDLEQDTWVRAVERPPARGGSPRAWLATVMRRLRSDRGRAEGRRARREQVAARTGAEPAASDLASRAEAHGRVVEAVLALPPAERDLVLERFWEGREPADIAARLGVPASTVRSRLARAAERLRGALRERTGGDPRAMLVLLAGEGAGVPAPAAPPGVDGGSGSGAPSGGPGLPTGVGAILAAVALLMAVSAGFMALRSGGGDRDGTGGVAPGGAAVAAAPREDAPPPAPAPVGVEAPPPGDGPASPPPAGREIAGKSTSRAGRIELTVRDGAGAPVAGAEVIPFRDAMGKDDWTAADGVAVQTDGEGRVSLDWPPGGDGAPAGGEGPPAGGEPAGAAASPGGAVDAGAVPEPPPPVRLFVSGGGGTAFSRTIQVDAGGTVSVDLVLVPPRVLRGRITGESGEPVAGATASLRVPHDDGGGMVMEVACDATGVFTLDGLPAAATAMEEAWIRARAPGHVERWITLAPGAAGPFDIALVRALEVRGRCVDRNGAPVAGVQVEADGTNGAWTGGDGRFVLPGIGPDADSLRLLPEAHAARAVALDRAAGRVVDLGDLVLEAGRTLAGIVVDGDGLPLDNVSLNIESVDVDQFVAYGGTSEDGRFELAHLGPGEHVLHAFAGAGPDGFSRRAVVRGLRPGGDPVRVVCTSGGVVRIDFFDAATGEPVRTHEVKVATERVSGGAKTSQGTWSDDGVTSHEVSFEDADAYRCTVTAPGYDPLVLEVRPDPDGGTVLRADLTRRP